MIDNNYINFIADSKFPNGNRDEDLWFIFNNKEMIVKEEKGRIIIPTLKDIEKLIDGLEIKLHLGTLNGVHCFCGEVSNCVVMPKELKQISLRKEAALIDVDLFGVCGRASQLLHFHKTNKYCGICGSPNKTLENEFSMECSQCKYTVYPSICPAIIVGVTKEDKILLANNKNFPKGLYSVVAGFLDPNETLENCVKREVFEEVGLKVKNIRYFGNQPWPYPNSLMIGFIAEYDGGEIMVDGKEILDANWYSKSDLPEIPEKTTIARSIIDYILEKII